MATTATRRSPSSPRLLRRGRGLAGEDQRRLPGPRLLRSRLSSRATSTPASSSASSTTLVPDAEPDEAHLARPRRRARDAPSDERCSLARAGGLPAQCAGRSTGVALVPIGERVRRVALDDGADGGGVELPRSTSGVVVFERRRGLSRSTLPARGGGGGGAPATARSSRRCPARSSRSRSRRATRSTKGQKLLTLEAMKMEHSADRAVRRRGRRAQRRRRRAGAGPKARCWSRIEAEKE